MPASALRALSTAILAATVLAACGGGEDKKPATQIAARVNEGEISVHQINGVLARAGGIKPEQAKEAARQVLDKLIDQELLLQKAQEGKLEREPKIMQALEAARRDILARAYLEKTVSGQAPAESAEVAEYYAAHPELFSARRIYQFQELAIQAPPPDFLGRLQEKMASVKSMADVAGWLRSEKIPFAANAATKAAEQIPLELLPRFHQMKDGQIAVIPSPGAVQVVLLAASRDMPMDEQAARPFIEQFLANRKRMAAAEQEVKRLREQAKIEYLGDFADAGAAPKAAAAPAQPAPAAAGQGAAHIDKGIAGLK